MWKLIIAFAFIVTAVAVVYICSRLGRPHQDDVLFRIRDYGYHSGLNGGMK